MDNINRWLALLANFGVITGIFFLGLEMRHNTRTSQASTYQDLTNRIIALNEGSLNRPDLGVGGTDTKTDFENLSLPEQRQLRSLSVIRFRYGDVAFYQYELGIITEERFQSIIAPVTNSVCAWINQDEWSRLEPNFVSSYRDFIAEAISGC